jgi:uncharacterized protein (TIGR00304 family)
MWLLVFLGFILILVGTQLIILGFIRTMERHSVEENGSYPPPGKPRVRGGGVVLIGPIPIIVGSDYKYAAIAIILAIILMLIVIIWGLNFQ